MCDLIIYLPSFFYHVFVFQLSVRLRHHQAWGREGSKEMINHVAKKKNKDKKNETSMRVLVGDPGANRVNRKGDDETILWPLQWL